MKDWEDKVSDDCVYCPRCGHSAESTQWWTQEQLKEIQESNSYFNLSKQLLEKAYEKMKNKKQMR